MIKESYENSCSNYSKMFGPVLPTIAGYVGNWSEKKCPGAWE